MLTIKEWERISLMIDNRTKVLQDKVAKLEQELLRPKAKTTSSNKKVELSST